MEKYRGQTKGTRHFSQKTPQRKRHLLQAYAHTEV